MDGGSRAPAVVREARSQRQQVRVDAPLTVMIDGRSHDAADWSLGGFRLTGGCQKWRRGDGRRARLLFPFHGFELAMEVGCVAAFVDAGTGASGWRFADLDPSQQALLRHMINAHLAGRIVTAEGLLAVARDVEPAAPASAPASGRPLFRALRRAIGYGAAAAAALVLLGAVGLSAYGRFFTVEAQYAAVSAPTVQSRASADGRLEGYPLQAGGKVARGAPLFTVVDDDLDAEIRLTRAEIARAESRVAGLGSQREIANEFFANYRQLARADLKKAMAAEEAARVALGAVQRERERTERLHADGVLSAQRLDQIRSREADALRALREAEAMVQQAEANTRLAGGGFYYTGSRVEGGTPEQLSMDLALATKDLAVLAEKLSALEAKRSSLASTSPCDCIIDAVLAAPPEWVEAGTVVYRLRETDDARLLVEARVPHAEAKLLRLGDRAVIAFADEEVPRQGRIVDIRHGPTLEPRSGLPPSVTGDRRLASVLVRVERENLSQAVGLPAQVRFPLAPRVVLSSWLGGDIPFAAGQASDLK